MQEQLERDFGVITDLIRDHAKEAPGRLALTDGEASLDYGALDALMDRVAAALQRDGVGPGRAIATCAGTSILHLAVFLGAVRAGVAVAPLAPSSAPADLARMLADAGAEVLFVDAAAAPALAAIDPSVTRVALDGGDASAARPLEDWLAPPGARPDRVAIEPESPFNIIYSSGTTGEPKGIVQGHRMRWLQVMRSAQFGFTTASLSLVSTPLYSNTTLVTLLPTIAFGGGAVLMAKFDAGRYLQLAARYRVTHTMLVPVQYQRVMARPDFADHDLSSFRVKFCTSAPFAAALKRDVLRRWPGALIEFYGMTEGGGTCILQAHANPEKLHTVGRPAEGHDIRLIDDDGREVPPGEAGEIVGHSRAMMTGYHRRAEKTRETEWFDAEGKRFFRTGDVGRFDADGFLVLLDRKKDMIISGGFNVYPSDLEAILRPHPAVADVAVVGVPSVQWGETPVAFVVRGGEPITEAELLAWFNARVGKTQRLGAVSFVGELPRSAIGKVLKRELRDRYAPPAST